MSSKPETTMSGDGGRASRRVYVAALQTVALLALGAWAFWSEVHEMFLFGRLSSDWAHVYATPLIAAVLVYRRWPALREAVTGGSFWGILLMLAAVACYGASTWPFHYRYVQLISLVPLAAGIILTVGGWRVLKLCLPMILLLALSIPIGPRYYARLIIFPETYTFKLTRAALDLLPGVNVRAEGQDLHFTRGETTGSIALGEPNRGASLIMAYPVIGVFVVFSRIRPSTHVVLMAAAAVPITLLCNGLRLLTWGVAAIYAGVPPGDPAPRDAAAVISLVVAYLLFAGGCGAMAWIGRRPPDEDAA